MGLRDMRWSAMLKRRGQGVELYMLGEGGLGWSERVASGAFPSGLGRSGHFLNVKQLLSSMDEVPVKLSAGSEVCCSCCSLHLGES